MKYFFSLILILLTFCSFSQDGKSDKETSLTLDNFNALYIIDSSFFIRQPTTRRKNFNDGRISFLSINEGRAFLSVYNSSRIYRIFGEMNNLKITENDLHQKVIQFYVRGKDLQGGKIRSFEITILSDEEYVIHYFDKLGQSEVFFTARFPTDEEYIEYEEFIKL